MSSFHAVSDGSGEVHSASGLFDIRGRHEDWFLVAGFWRPADRRNAESFVALTRAAERTFAGNGARQLMTVERERWLDWIDPQKDNRWLYDK